MNNLYIRVGKALVTMILLEQTIKGINICLDAHYKNKIKKGLKNGSYVEVDGKYYKVTVEEAK